MILKNEMLGLRDRARYTEECWKCGIRNTTTSIHCRKCKERTENNFFVRYDKILERKYR